MLLTGLAGLTGAAANTTAARTGTTSSAGGNVASNYGKTNRDLAGYQTQLMSPMLEQILKRISDPSGAIAPLRTAARESVNTSFSSLPDTIRTKYGQTSGKSGKMGTAQRQAEVGRVSGLASVESDFASKAIGVQNDGLSLAERLFGINEGGSTQQTGSQQYTQTGTQTQPGSVMAGASQGSLQMLSTLLALNSMLQGGGNG